MPREKLMRCIEAFVLIQNESKINIARNRLYEDVWRKQGGRKRVRKGKKRCKMDTLLHRHFYTQTLVRRHAFTHRGVYAQTLLHTEVLTHRRLDTTKLAQSTGNVLPSATSYCKACISTSRYYSFAQNTSPYYFVLQRLHTVLPSTTLYKCTTKLAQRCTKYFPVLLCTTKLAQSTSDRRFYARNPFTHKRFYTQTLFYTLLRTESLQKVRPVVLRTTKHQSLHKGREETQIMLPERAAGQEKRRRKPDYAGGMRGTRKTEMKIT